MTCKHKILGLLPVLKIDQANAISLDRAGNCYLTGSFYRTATFGNTTLTNVGVPDLFAAKYDPAGNLLWARQAGGSMRLATFFGLEPEEAAVTFSLGPYPRGQLDSGFIELDGLPDVAEQNFLVWQIGVTHSVDGQARQASVSDLLSQTLRATIRPA